MALSKSIKINVKLDFPDEVDLTDLEHKEYGINHLQDFNELLFDYSRTKMRNGYLPLKEEGFRWMFFLDTYEVYTPEEAKNLELNEVFLQKWYKGKYMTILFLNEDFEFFKRILPASKKEFEEEPILFRRLYKILKDNQDKVGGYIKRLKKDN